MAFEPVWVKSSGELYKRYPKIKRKAILGVRNTKSGTFRTYDFLRPTLTNYIWLAKQGKKYFTWKTFEPVLFKKFEAVRTKKEFKPDFTLLPISPKTAQVIKKTPGRGTKVYYAIYDNINDDVNILDTSPQRFSKSRFEFLKTQVESGLASNVIFYENQKGQLQKPDKRTGLKGLVFDKKTGDRQRQTTPSYVELDDFEIVNNKKYLEFKIQKGAKFQFIVPKSIPTIQEALKQIEPSLPKKLPAGKRIQISYDLKFVDPQEPVTVSGLIDPANLMDVKKAFRDDIVRQLATYGYRFTNLKKLKEVKGANPYNYKTRELSDFKRTIRVKEQFGTRSKKVNQKDLLQIEGGLIISGTVDLI